MPDVFNVTGIVSASIVGKDCFIGGGAYLADFRFDGKTVHTIKAGKIIDTENIFFGCCLGNNVYLGSGCVVAPGRIVPSNTHIVLEKDRSITSFKEKSPAGFRLIQ